jgi:hypothetical protein
MFLHLGECCNVPPPGSGPTPTARLGTSEALFVPAWPWRRGQQVVVYGGEVNVLSAVATGASSW